jgi:tetratricopeptide (TPR) repeat protein
MLPEPLDTASDVDALIAYAEVEYDRARVALDLDSIVDAEQILTSLCRRLSPHFDCGKASGNQSLLYASTLTSLALVQAARGAEHKLLLEQAVAIYAKFNWTTDFNEQVHRANYGIALIKLGQLAAGVTELDAAVSAGVATADAYLQLGQAHRGLGNMTSAETALRRAVATSPSNPVARSELANLLHSDARRQEAGTEYAAAAASYLVSGRTEIALETVENALRAGVSSVPLLVIRSMILLQLGHAGEALVAADEALKTVPGEAGALAAKGRALSALSQFDGALQVLQEAARQVPGDGTLQFDLSIVLVELKEYGSALECIDLAAQRGMTSLAVDEIRAQILALSGQEAEASQLVGRILSVRADSAIGLATRGLLFHRKKEYGRAEHDLRRSVALNPALIWARLELIDTLHDSGSYTQALTELEEVMAVLPIHTWGLSMKGRLLNLLGDYEGAIPVLNRAIDLSPTEASNYYWLGWSFEGLNDAQQALTAYLRALANDPNDLWAMKGVADAYSLARRESEARPHYEQVVAALSDPDLTPELTVLKGWCCYRLRRHAEAQSLYEQAFAQDDRMIPSIFDYGLILLCAGRGSAGVREYRRGTELLRHVRPERGKAFCRVAIHDLEVAKAEYPDQLNDVTEIVSWLRNIEDISNRSEDNHDD